MGNTDETRELLISTAGRLLVERGLGAVSVEDVAQAAGYNRRTVYRYYSGKDELVFDVVERLLEDWNRVQLEVYDRLEGRADLRLEAFLTRLTEELEGRLPFLRFLGEFDFVYRDSHPFRPSPEERKRFDETAHLTEELLGKILDLGVGEGSLRLPLPRSVVIATLATVLWGLAQRVALRDDLIRGEFGVTGGQIVRAQIHLTMEALREGI